MKFSGDTWTIYHGNCLDILKSLPDQSVDAIVTDPPYGTTNSNFSKSTIRNRSVVPFGFSWDTSLPTGWLKEAVRVVRPGGAVMAFTDNISLGRLWGEGEEAGLHPLNTFHWEKPDSGLNVRKNFSSSVESGVFFRVPGKVLCWNGGGWCRNIFRACSAHKEHGGSVRFHPTEKPVSLMRWMVGLVTFPGATVLDPFMGSGSTGVAALLEGRKFIGVEMNEDYVQVAKNRLSSTVWGSGKPWGTQNGGSSQTLEEFMGI